MRVCSTVTDASSLIGFALVTVCMKPAVADDPDVLHRRRAVAVLQVARLFEIIRAQMLAGEKAEPWRCRIADKGERKADRDLLPVGQLRRSREIKRLVGFKPGRAPRFDVGARIRGVEHQHREALVAGEIIAVEGGEGEMPATMLGHILRRSHGQELEISAVKLNERIAGAERMLPARRDGESQPLVMRTHGVEIAAGKHQVVDGFCHVL